MNYRKQFGKQRGFTLVELLLVLVILALIAGLVLPGRRRRATIGTAGRPARPCWRRGPAG